MAIYRVGRAGGMVEGKGESEDVDESVCAGVGEGGARMGFGTFGFLGRPESVLGQSIMARSWSTSSVVRTGLRGLYSPR